MVEMTKKEDEGRVDLRDKKDGNEQQWWNELVSAQSGVEELHAAASRSRSSNTYLVLPSQTPGHPRRRRYRRSIRWQRSRLPCCRHRWKLAEMSTKRTSRW